MPETGLPVRTVDSVRLVIERYTAGKIARRLCEFCVPLRESG